MARIELLSTQDGYAVDGEPRAGFADDASLPVRQRRRIAQWARKWGTPTAEQVELLDRPAPTSSAAATDAADLASVWRSPMVAHLRPDEQQRVRHPEAVLANSGSYPLTVSQLSALVGCTDRQIRHWDKLRLLPARPNERNERLFGPAAAMRATWLHRNGQHAVTTLSGYAEPDRTSELLAMTAAILHDQAASFPGTERLVDELADHMETVSLQMVGHEPALAGPDVARALGSRIHGRFVSTGRAAIDVPLRDEAARAADSRE